MAENSAVSIEEAKCKLKALVLRANFYADLAMVGHPGGKLYSETIEEVYTIGMWLKAAGVEHPYDI